MRRRSELYSILLLCLLSVAVSSAVWAAGEVIPITDAIWTTEGDQYQAYMGESVATAGDVNGDDFDDFIVGARFYDSGPDKAGVAWLFYGSATGPSTTPVALLSTMPTCSTVQ